MHVPLHSEKLYEASAQLAVDGKFSKDHQNSDHKSVFGTRLNVSVSPYVMEPCIFKRPRNLIPKLKSSLFLPTQMKIQGK